MRRDSLARVFRTRPGGPRCLRHGIHWKHWRGGAGARRHRGGHNANDEAQRAADAKRAPRPTPATAGGRRAGSRPTSPPVRRQYSRWRMGARRAPVEVWRRGPRGQRSENPCVSTSSRRTRPACSRHSKNQQIGPVGCALVKEELDEWFVESRRTTFTCRPWPLDPPPRQNQRPSRCQQVNNSAAASALERVKRELGPDGADAQDHREALINDGSRP
jgi:hypothetical protein